MDGSRLFDWLMGHRALAATLLLVATGLVGAGASRVAFDNSYDSWFIDGDPALEAYDDLVEEFGSDAAIVVAVDTRGDPYSAESLQVVRLLSDTFAALDGVAVVWSLTHTDAMRDTGAGIAVGPLIGGVPLAAEEKAAVAALVEASPLYDALVSPDGATTTIVVTIERSRESFEPPARLVREVKSLGRDLAPDRQLAFAGGPVMDEATYRYSERDARIYGPAMALIVVVALLLLFRSVVAVVVPLAVVVLSILWSYGTVGWLGWNATVLTTVLVPMLAAVGVADSIHLLQQFRLHGRGDQSPSGALREAFVAVFRPCLITSVTTAAGMASLAAALMPAMRELGVAAAVGVMAAFALTVVGVPILLSAIPQRWLGGLVGSRKPPLARGLSTVASWAVRRRRAVLLATALLLVLSVAGIARIGVGTRLLSYYFADDPLVVDAAVVDRAVGGSFPLEVLVEAAAVEDLLEPSAMARVEAIGALLSTLPATGGSLSGLDFLMEARRVFLGDPPGVLARPETAAEAAQLLLMLGPGEDRERYLSVDNRRARIEVPVSALQYEKLVSTLPSVQRQIDVLAGDVVHARVTGLAHLMGQMEVYLLASELRSFGLAFALVLGFIALAFASVRIGLLSVVPNMMPLVLTLGVMGWLGIQLDATTAMIAPVLLGIVVDDTVHVLQRAIEARRRGADVPQAFAVAVGEVGHAVLLTTLVLLGGFLTPLLGSFKPNLHFALLAALGLVLALAADLLVLPAVAALAPGLVPGNNEPARP